MTVPPLILLGISVLFIVVGIISMPWLKGVSLVFILIGAVVSIYAVAGLIGRAFRKKAPYLESDIKNVPGIWPSVVGFFVFFLFFRLLSGRLPENLVAPVLFIGLGSLFVFGIFALIRAKRHHAIGGEVPASPASRTKEKRLATAIIASVILVFIALIWMGSPSTDTSEWILFKSEEDKFEILFPNLPQEEQGEWFLKITGRDERIPYKYSNYFIGHRDRSTYIVQTINYPPEIIDLDHKILLEEFLEDMVERSSALELVSSELTDFGEYKALDFIYQSYGIFYTHGRIVATEQTLYKIMANYDKKHYFSSREYNSFINSFRGGF